MTVTLTPVAHQVFNPLDEQGVTLALKRLKEESNAEYKQRLLDVCLRKADSTYRGLLNGITRELGLEFYRAATIEAAVDGSGAYLLENPAVVFEGPYCYLVSNADPNSYTILATYDLMDRAADEWYLGGLIDSINATGYFTASVYGDTSEWTRSLCIYKQSSLTLVTAENIAVAAQKVKLENDSLIDGTIAIRSPNLFRRMSTEGELAKSGDYYVDLDAGMISCMEAPVSGSLIRYMHRQNPKIFWASPVIIHDMQAEEFLTKIFDQVYDGLGGIQNGPPSVLGTYILNELYAVSPVYWGI